MPPARLAEPDAFVLKACRSRRHGNIVASDFEPAWWLPGAHLQTVWAARIRPAISIPWKRERLELPDGDFIDLDFACRKPDRNLCRNPKSPDIEYPKKPPADPKSLVILLHGLQGSSRSLHIRGLADTLVRHGWHCLVMHFRGCSGEANRLPRAYHSGEIEDFAFLLRSLRRHRPHTRFAAVGFSLGGSVLLNFLARHEQASDIEAAVAVCVPLCLARAAERLDRKGLSYFYRRHFIDDLRRSAIGKFRRRPGPIDLDLLRRIRLFREFDDLVTAPLHGFRDADHYYEAASARPHLHRIRCPTLVLHALDDPFMTPAVVPEAHELSASTRFEISRGGGHIGFVEGHRPWRARYWLESRIPRFLSPRLNRGDSDEIARA